MTISEAKAREIFQMIKRHSQEAYDEVQGNKDKWLERISFYRGLHYSVNNGTFRLDADDPTGELREVHNFIPAFVKAAVAIRTKNIPNPKIPAVDGDQQSMARAKATERLFQSFVDDDILTGAEYIRAVYSAVITGGAWLKVYWDPFKGKPVPNEPEKVNVKLAAEDGTEYEELVERDIETDVFGAPIAVKAFEGKIVLEHADLFDGWPDPCATSKDTMRFWIHRKVRPREELESKYEKDMFGNHISWDAGADALWNEKQNILNTGDTKYKTDDCQLLEYWGAPSTEFPNGILCIFSGDSVIYLGACPYVPARLPVELLLGDNIVPGGLYADGAVEHLIQPQKTLNRAETKIRELLDRMLNPHILVPHAADVDAEIFGEIGAQIIYYNAGYPPHILHAPEIPSSMFTISGSMVDRMKEISTYSDITRGDVPGRVDSGRAIGLLQESEVGMRMSDIMLYKKAMLGAMMQCMYLARQYYPDGRMIRTFGEDAWTLYEFYSEDYDFEIDLAPEPFSSAPNSRVLRWAETMEAWAAGLFNDEMPGSKSVRRLLELDNQNRSTIDPQKHHVNRAMSENQQIIAKSRGVYTGPVNPVREFHDDEIHLEHHNLFRNSDDYLDLTPEARAAMDQHCEEHESQLQAKMGDFSQNMAGLGPLAANQADPKGQPGQAAPASGNPPQ